MELAVLQYNMTRLIRPSGEELELMDLDQQRGGIGIMAGGGESHLELQRRKLRSRENLLKKKLVQISKRRKVQRNSRHLPVVALVGYTNVGKSALFNKLTRAKAEVDDALFATLDPKIRACYLPELGATCLLADTVGFVQDLPHSLIKAFGSTLEEVVDADIIIHVQDASLPPEVMEAHARSVHLVLEELGMHFVRINEAPQMRDGQPDSVDESVAGSWPWPKHTPLLAVWNKTDLMDESSSHANTDVDIAEELCISAKTGFGLQRLVDQICSGLVLTGADCKLKYTHKGATTKK